MTLPTSGPLSLSDIQTEFGGVNPIGLGEYYAGGGLVPPGTTGTYGAVPSSGAISIQNFYGTSAAVTETQTVTVGTFSFKGFDQYGFSTLLGYGSIADGTFGFISDAPIEVLAWANTNNLTFRITGVYPNSGWTKLTINGVDFLRAVGSHSTGTSPNFSHWDWSGASNVFGTTIGASVPAVFTQ